MFTRAGLRPSFLRRQHERLRARQTPTAPPAHGQPPAPSPQGQAPGGRGAPPPGPRPDGYTQYTRAPASEDDILRGRALYETNCAKCHAPDLRGTVATGEHLVTSKLGLTDVVRAELSSTGRRRQRALTGGTGGQEKFSVVQTVGIRLRRSSNKNCS